MTGPVEYEFEDGLMRTLFAGSRAGMSVDVVTLGCRLNIHESDVIRDKAAARGADGRHRRQYLRRDE